MGRPSARLFFGFLVAVLAVQTGLLLGKGVLLINTHEGDALNLLEVILRMGAGELPHLDFSTPIGIMAFLPISWLTSLGVGAGHAILGGMVLVALGMLPAIWWVGYSRLPTLLAYAFGAFVIVLCTALVYGGAAQVLSISMYYNRWAWAVASLLVMLAMLPAKRNSGLLDGLVIGLALAFLALSKATFFAALFPGILLALILRRQWMALLVGLITGLVVVAMMTLALGVDFWLAYIHDLRLVSASPMRTQPTVSLAALLVGPSFLAINLCLLASIVLLRQAGRAAEGIILLVFAPAFVYITYQNWGNDPKWLFLLAILLLALRPGRHVNNGFGWDVGRMMGLVSVVSFALFLPSLFNLTFSDVQLAQTPRASYAQVLPGHKNSDVMMTVNRMYGAARQQGFTLDDPKITAIMARSKKPPRDMLFGQPLPVCELQMGLVGVLQQMAWDLDRIDGTAGKTVFVADTFSNLWMFGKTRPLIGGAPWYYGGDAGMSKADFVLVPLCPVTPGARSLALKQISADSGKFDLREVTRNGLFILLKRVAK